MTVNEAIKKHIEDCEHRIGNILGFMQSNSDADTFICEENIAVLKTAIQALEEIQQYRAIGTIEEFKASKENERKCEDCAGCTNWNCDCANVRVQAIDEFASALANKDNIVKYDIDELMESSGHYDLACNYLRAYIDEIAEEMRGGGNDVETN